MRPVPKPSRRVKTLEDLKQQLGRKKVRKEACPLEESEQMALAGWLDAIGACWVHVPNERIARHLPKIKAINYMRKMHRKGFKRGFPDILIFDRPYPVENGKVFSGVAIELKRRDKSVSTLSPDQAKWLSALTERGWLCNTFYGADSAIDWLKGLGYGVRR